ncbi:MAG: hypothetical protein GY950_25410, partial [bacterium]|nr:hypothetical protein [bacterium]
SKKMKLSLEQLKVKSITTYLSKEEAEMIYGGKEVPVQVTAQCGEGDPGDAGDGYG